MPAAPSDQHAENLDLLRKALHRDIDEDSVSLIPPGAVIKTMVKDPATIAAIAAMVSAVMLRRLKRGAAPDEIIALGQAYYGMSAPGSARRLDEACRACAYVNQVKAGTMDRDAAIAQMKTWKDGSVARATALLDAIIDVYRRENLTEYAPPDTVREHRPDGEVFNDSFATSSPHVKLEVLRFIRHDQQIGGMIRSILTRTLIALVLIALAGLCLYHGRWVIALLLSPFILFTGQNMILLPWIPRLIMVARRAYDSALLTAAIIEKSEPLTLLHLAELGNGGGKDYYGLKRVRVDALPLTEIRRGVVIPCVSLFEDGGLPDRWADFTPRPIAWGTSDKAKISDLLVKLGPDPVARLRRCLKENILPSGVDQVLVLDGEFKPIPVEPKARKPGSKLS